VEFEAKILGLCQRIIIIISIISSLTEPNEPTSLHVNSTTAAMVSLQWKMPSQPNGIITKYEIQYQTTSSSQTVSATSATHTVTGLVGDTEYQFRVRAFTRVGAGPWSNLVIGRTGELPNKT